MRGGAVQGVASSVAKRALPWPAKPVAAARGEEVLAPEGDGFQTTPAGWR